MATPKKAAKDTRRAVAIVADTQAVIVIDEALRGLGFNVTVFEEADRAMAAISAGGVDLILVDDGHLPLGATPFLRLLAPVVEPGKTIFIVIGARRSAAVAEASEIAEVYLEWPFEVRDLREAVATARWVRESAMNVALPKLRGDEPQAARATELINPDPATERGVRPTAVIATEREPRQPAVKRFKSTLSFQPRDVLTVMTPSGAVEPLNAAPATRATNVETHTVNTPFGVAATSDAGGVRAPGARLRPPSGGEGNDDGSDAVRGNGSGKGDGSGEPKGKPTVYQGPGGDVARRVRAELHESGGGAEPTVSASGSRRASSQRLDAPQDARTTAATSGRTRPTQGSSSGRWSPISGIVERTIIADRYELRGVLGTGGMAVVYRAHDRELDEEVALKLLRDGRSDEESLTRFRHELRICRRLSHPNIVQTFEFGVWQGRRFLTMELLEGNDMAAVLKARGKAFGVLEAVELFEQAARGLDVAHRAGVIHRDIKPHNLFILKDGRRLKIMDFGIAKSDEISQTMTAQAHVLGTPAYLAPERLRDHVELSAATDLYSLGVALYQVLTGNLPFSGPDVPTLLTAVLMDKAIPPRQRRADIPLALDAIVMQALSREQRDRQASCGLLADQLEAVARDLRRAWA